MLRNATSFVSCAPDGGEHQFFVRILVVHDEQAVIRPAERDEAEIIVVVAELHLLSSRRLLQGVEGRRAGQHRVTPADEHAAL